MFLFLSTASPIASALSLVIFIASAVLGSPLQSYVQKVLPEIVPEVLKPALHLAAKALPFGSDHIIILWMLVSAVFFVLPNAPAPHPDDDRAAQPILDREELRLLIGRLPLERWLNAESRAALTPRALLSRLRARRVRCEGLVERSELVKALEATPHDDLCAICYDEYEEGTELRLLPCNHTFHCECVDRWLLDCGASRRAVACPLCNHPLDTKSAARAAAVRGREQQWRRHPWREAVRAVERWARQVGHPFAIWAPRQPMQVVH